MREHHVDYVFPKAKNYLAPRQRHSAAEAVVEESKKGKGRATIKRIRSENFGHAIRPAKMRDISSLLLAVYVAPRHRAPRSVHSQAMMPPIRIVQSATARFLCCGTTSAGLLRVSTHGGVGGGAGDKVCQSVHLPPAAGIAVGQNKVRRTRAPFPEFPSVLPLTAFEKLGQ